MELFLKHMLPLTFIPCLFLIKWRISCPYTQDSRFPRLLDVSDFGSLPSLSGCYFYVLTFLGHSPPHHPFSPYSVIPNLLKQRKNLRLTGKNRYWAGNLHPKAAETCLKKVPFPGNGKRYLGFLTANFLHFQSSLFIYFWVLSWTADGKHDWHMFSRNCKYE